MPNDSAVIANEQIPVDALTDPVWIRIRDLIYQVSGIYQAEKKFYLLVSRCNVRMKAVGSRTPREYLDYLTARPIATRKCGTCSMKLRLARPACSEACRRSRRFAKS
jgi:hypothetical protein